MEHTEQYIKSQLFELLQSDSDNYSQILTLSNELAQMDKKNIRFSVDAGIITRLGKELVGKGETAISELIKTHMMLMQHTLIWFLRMPFVQVVPL